MRTRAFVGFALVGLVAVGFYARMPVVRAEVTAGKATRAAVGEAAPGFALKDEFGKEFQLSEFKGKIVVLEWLNPECPVSKGHHEKGTMQDTYKKYAKDMVWLGIDSTGGAKGEDERVYAARMEMAYPILLDGDGKVGHAYGATNTPHLFVIDKSGKLAYAGAIDDQGKTNYVADAVTALIEGKPVAKPKTKPYGCGVHYARGH